MNKKVSYIISAIFQPIIVNFVIILLIFNYFPSLAALSKNKIITIISVIVSLTLILPIIVVSTLKLTNQIESIQLKNLNDRKWPFIFTCIGYLMSFYLLNKVGVSVIILKYLLAGCISIITLTIISFFWQISVHTASMGTLVSLIIILNNYLQIDLRLWIAVCISLSGLVASARYFSNAHNLPQLVCGFLVGLIPIYVIM